jgi:putative tryptophan/tyrosine transport system substrate-binding protein
VKRREFAGRLGGTAVAWPLAAQAQQPAKIARIGLIVTNAAATAHLSEAFRRGLRDLGYVEGRNFAIEARDARGQIEAFAGLASELVALNVDVIVAFSTASSLAAKQATTTIPIVFPTVPDPVTSGLVASLARPGGNITGLSNLNAELVGKGMELLKQAVPGAGRLAVLWQPGAFGERTEAELLKNAAIAAQTLGLRHELFEARTPAAIDGAFEEINRSGADSLAVMTGGMFLGERRRIVDLVTTSRLPAIYPFREFVDAGGLMSYGPSFVDLFRRAATYVDKILKGAKPADLPVEQPTKFELVINAKTARALDLALGPLLLAQAEEIIE